MSLCYFINKKLGSDYEFYRSAMFHGVARRPNAEYPLLDYCYGDKLEYGLSISKNTFYEADIFKPNNNLIVSEKIKKKMTQIKNIDFKEVTFEKLFNAEINDDYEVDWNLDFDGIIGLFCNDPKLIDAANCFWELIVPTYRNFKNNYDDTVEIHIDSDVSSFDTLLSGKMFDDYPVFWCKGLFLSQELYEDLRADINEKYFTCLEIEI